MPKGYWIGRVDVTNAENYPHYMQAAKLAYEKYNARFLVRGGAYDAVEGEARSRNFVVEFESIEQARACYNSPEYAAARKIRQANAAGEVLIIEGVE